MRGSDERSGSLFSYVDLEAPVRRDHPLRTIREIANAALADLTENFAELYLSKLACANGLCPCLPGVSGILCVGIPWVTLRRGPHDANQARTS
jgi:hypothetical protein